ncbi:MAG: replication initiation and membrane attachment family protein [Culicoidibacterales bacterium]
MVTDYRFWHEIQPTNPYVVQSEGVLSEYDRKTLFSLYLPIVGSQAITLYMILWEELFQQSTAHFRLLTQMNCSLPQLVESRKKLESLGLLKTYCMQSDVPQFIYELVLPATPKIFFNDPVLSALLYSFTDDAHYRRTKAQFELPYVDTAGYIEISATFTESYELEFLPLDIPGGIDHAPSRHRADVQTEHEFDEQLFFMNLPKGILAPTDLTKETMNMIAKQAYVYDIPANEMAHLVIQATNDQRLDIEQLRKDARNYYRMQKPATKLQFSTQVQPGQLRAPNIDVEQTPQQKLVTMFETTSPLQFLTNRLGRKPNQFERELLEKLLIEYKLQPGVINVVIDYSLRKTENQFRESYIEKVAASWSTQQIQTVEAAMDQAKKSNQVALKAQSKKTSSRKKTAVKRTEIVPTWDATSPELSETEQAEQLRRFEELLEQLK